MKKLSLKNLKLDSNDLLQREQLKSVFGGYGPCSVYDSDDGQWYSGFSVEDAQALYHDQNMVTGYCCASC